VGYAPGMQKRLEGKTAMITGAGSGIGRATALRLGQEGARIFACDIDAAALDDFASEAKGEGIQVDTHVFDVSDGDACRAAVKAAVETCGRLDVLCNIAGISQLNRFENYTDDVWNRIIGTNLSSVFFLSQAAMPHLIETQGNIVNMASTAGIQGQAYNAVYCAAKHGVVAITKSNAQEFARKGVRVNAVCPGGVITPLLRATTMPEGADPELFGRMMPLLSLAHPEEIAAAVAYLASPEARYITGHTLTLDGGQTI
jgi:meso-butanediol dehydrogenase/(S,S)-butanediol dehydrogenase/diacetyl reductase